MAGLAVRISYDRDTDAATIYLVDDIGPGGAPGSAMCDLEVQGGAVILLLSEGGRLVGIEVLGASRLLPSQLLGEGTPPETPV